MPAEVNQIVIECVREDDGTLGWVFDAWPMDDSGGQAQLICGAASDLITCLEALLDWAKTNAV